MKANLGTYEFTDDEARAIEFDLNAGRGKRKATREGVKQWCNKVINRALKQAKKELPE